jgi:Raf kinase inhibitor-like YbhB/YbcL family protein
MSRSSCLLTAVAVGLLCAVPTPSWAQALAKGLKKAPTITVTSPAVEARGQLPRKYTCDGGGARIPIEWGALPSGTKSVIVLVDDASMQKTFWANWIVWNIPPTVHALPEGAPLPAGAQEGVSDWGKPGWDPPCTKGEKRSYRISVFALNTTIGKVTPSPMRSPVLRASDYHVIGSGTMLFSYDPAQSPS